MNKKYLLSISIILFFIAAFGFLPLKNARAGSSDNVSGWAWSENIGWISFNCTNNGCPGANYGVKVSTSTGIFSGYAWSENVGWINFAPAGTYPASPNYQACLDLPGSGQTCDGVGDYMISGWVRACSVFQSGCSGALATSTVRGDWDGWIKLRGTNYGLSLDTGVNEVDNWSWGGDDVTTTAVIGWVSFNRKGCDTDKDGFSNGGPNCPLAGTPIANYQVRLVLNNPPNAPTNLSTSPDYCFWANNFSATFDWDYSDLDGDPQDAYQFQLDDTADFSSPVVSTTVTGQSTAYTLSPANLSWSQTYYWQVRVKDNKGNWSNFSGSSFTTLSHDAPYPDFGPSPSTPSVGEVVTFVQDTAPTQSWCYNGGQHLCAGDAGVGYAWDFGNGKTSNRKINTTTTYDTVQRYTVTLTITDNTLIPAIPCSASKDVNVQFALPWWREVSPF